MIWLASIVLLGIPAEGAPGPRELGRVKPPPLWICPTFLKGEPRPPLNNLVPTAFSKAPLRPPTGASRLWLNPGRYPNH